MPITGPDLGDEQGLGVEDLAAPLDQAVGLLGRLDVLHDPPVAAGRPQLAGVVHHPLERPPGGPHPLHRHDLVLEREDRLDLQGSSQPRLGLADPPAAAEVLERVEAEPDPQRRLGLEDVLDRGLFVRSRARRRDPGERQHPQPSAAGFAVDHLDPIALATLHEQPVGLPRGLDRSRDPARQVHRDDIVPGIQQRLPNLQEVADRGLRGGRHFGVVAQPLVEGVEPLHVELPHGLPLPAHVQADLVDPLLVGERAGQVVGAVGDDRDRAIERARYRTGQRRPQVARVRPERPAGGSARGVSRRPGSTIRRRPDARAGTPRVLAEDLLELARLVHLGDDVAAADQLAVDEQLRDRGPARERRELLADTAGRGGCRRPRRATSSDCSIATVRAENPHAGASGVPFMNRITLCSEIASAIASRNGLPSCPGGSPAGGSPTWPGPGEGGAIGTGSNWVLDMPVSWL